MVDDFAKITGYPRDFQEQNQLCLSEGYNHSEFKVMIKLHI